MGGVKLVNSDEERLRNQIEEFVSRRDYDAALRFTVREADLAYGRQRYAQGIDVLNALIQLLKDRKVALWSIYIGAYPVSYTHLRAHETRHDLVCRLLLEKKKKKKKKNKR